MVNRIHFVKRISMLRGNTGLSRAEFAKRLNVTSPVVYKWECGYGNPDINNIVKQTLHEA